jgi:ParB/Sulfiredoxin domain
MIIPIDKIKVGKRHRRDLGDIDALARSIDSVGLLHLIVMCPDGTLIAGARRLAACKALGWDEVPVRIVDLDKVVRGEFAENSMRKDFTLSEAVAIKRALEPLEKAAAKERQQAAGGSRPGKRGGGIGVGNLPTCVRVNNKTRTATWDRARHPSTSSPPAVRRRRCSSLQARSRCRMRWTSCRPPPRRAA